MNLKVRNFIAQDGSRFSLLIDLDEDGLPLYYPTAYVSMSMGSLTANTQRVALYCLKRVYDWTSQNQIDLDLRFATKRLLTVPEVESLVQALSANTVKSDGATIGNSKINYHIDIVSEYFGWLFGHWITDSNAHENTSLIERLQTNLIARKVKGGSEARKKRERIAKKLSDTADAALMDLFEMFEQPRPAQARLFQYGVDYRNVLALRILYDLGVRLGELLSLKYCDFISSSGGEPAYLRIERNHDDAYDRRMNQPVAKTLGRKLPISNQLEQMILTYIGTYRADVSNVGYDDGSFIFVNHKKGKNQGLEIEISTFRSALGVIKARYKQLKGLHPHLLRHHWNYRFSEEAIRLGLSDTKTRQDREHWMGWVEGSQSARDYDLRHIQESANKHGRAIASDTARDKSARSGSSRYGLKALE